MFRTSNTHVVSECHGQFGFVLRLYISSVGLVTASCITCKMACYGYDRS